MYNGYIEKVIVANKALIYWLIELWGRDWFKGLDGEGICILASCEHIFFRVHEYLVQYQSNDIPIVCKKKSVINL